VERLSGQEPALSGSRLDELLDETSGLEPMLGGGRRPHLDRGMFLELLELDRVRRETAAETILEQGAGYFYGRAMVAVLSPGSRTFQAGKIWKVPYSYEQKLAAMDSLLRLDPAHALSGLVVALNNQDMGIQRAAILFMGQLQTDQAQSALLAILDDPRPELRQMALYALSDRWGLPAMKRLLSRRGLTVSEAARVLGQCTHVPRLLVPLIAALGEKRDSEADSELAQMSLIAAIVSLAEHLDDGDKAVAVEGLSGLLDSKQTGALAASRAVDGLRRIGTADARAAAIRYQTRHDTLDRVALTDDRSGNGQPSH
jgi:hypothetical protein